jgi:hypothetical protein
MAEALIEELPLESPLRSRFGQELKDLHEVVSGSDGMKCKKDRSGRKRSAGSR